MTPLDKEDFEALSARRPAVRQQTLPVWFVFAVATFVLVGAIFVVGFTAYEESAGRMVTVSEFFNAVFF